MMTLPRVIRLLVLVFMVLIMVFLFLIARTIYLGQQEEKLRAQAETEPSITETQPSSSSTSGSSSEEPAETEKPPQPVTVGEIETGPTFYDDPEDPDEERNAHLSSGRILIGDSRFEYLNRQIRLDKGDIVIAKGGEYYDWFEGTAVPQLKSILDMNPNYDVIINMGLNDCANNMRGGTAHFTPDYIAIINDLYVSYPETAFYYASIGPIKGPYPSVYGRIAPDELQLFIDIFNYTMRTQCMAQYLELGEYLYDGKPTYEDNVHYDAATDQLIYEYIKAHVRKSVYDTE